MYVCDNLDYASTGKNIGQGDCYSWSKERQEHKRQVILNYDFVEGCAWNEVQEAVPQLQLTYSEYPIAIFFSVPCKVKTEDRTTTACLVQAVAQQLNNDGTHCKWHGWVEMPQDADSWSFIQNIFNDKCLEVKRWHFLKDDTWTKLLNL